MYGVINAGVFTLFGSLNPRYDGVELILGPIQTKPLLQLLLYLSNRFIVVVRGRNTITVYGKRKETIVSGWISKCVYMQQRAQDLHELFVTWSTVNARRD